MNYKSSLILAFSKILDNGWLGRLRRYIVSYAKNQSKKNVSAAKFMSTFLTLFSIKFFTSLFSYLIISGAAYITIILPQPKTISSALLRSTVHWVVQLFSFKWGRCDEPLVRIFPSKFPHISFFIK